MRDSKRLMVARAPSRRLDGAIAIATGLASVCWFLYLMKVARLGAPIGADAGIWGLTGLDILAGNSPMLPPGYPLLLAMAGKLGLHVLEGGLFVSPLVAAAIPPIVYGAARLLGAHRAAGVLGALLCAIHPDMIEAGLTYQPEAVTALTVASLALVGAYYSRERSMRALLLLCLVVSWGVLTREHGLAFMLITLLYLFLFPARTGIPGLIRLTNHLVSPLLLLVVVLGTSLPFMDLARFPRQWSWVEKGGVPLSDLQTIYAHPARLPPAYLRPSAIVEAGPLADEKAAQNVYERYVAAMKIPDGTERLRTAIALNFQWARAVAGDLHVWHVAGILGLLLVAIRRRRGSLLLLPGLYCALLPSLVIWSQRRHASVMLPLAFLGGGLIFSSLMADLRRLFKTRTLGREQQDEALRADETQEEPAGGQGSQASSRRAWDEGGLALSWGISGLVVCLVVLLQLHWRHEQSLVLGQVLHQGDELRPIVAFGVNLRRLKGEGTFMGTRRLPSQGAYIAQLAAELPRARLGRVIDDDSDLPMPHIAWRCFLFGEEDPLSPAQNWARVFSYGAMSALQLEPHLSGDVRRCYEGEVLEPPRYLIVGPGVDEVGPLHGCEQAANP